MNQHSSLFPSFFPRGLPFTSLRRLCGIRFTSIISSPTIDGTEFHEGPFHRCLSSPPFRNPLLILDPIHRASEMKHLYLHTLPPSSLVELDPKTFESPRCPLDDTPSLQRASFRNPRYLIPKIAFFYLNFPPSPLKCFPGVRNLKIKNLFQLEPAAADFLSEN